MGWDRGWWRGSGLALVLGTRPAHQGWNGYWDGGKPRSSGVSCGTPWVWQPESLRVPLTTRSKPSWLSGPVPVSSWSDLQQRGDNVPRALVSHQEQQ